VLLAVLLPTWHLGDHPLHVHAHHGIGVDQLAKLRDHRVQHHPLARGLHPLAVTGKPRLQVVLVIGQPACPAPHKGSPFINLLVPGYKQFDQGFRLTVAAITKAFRDAWQTDRPTEGSALYAVLEPVARAADDWDFEQPAEAQVDKFMGVVAEAGRRLAEDDLSEATAEEVVADLENLLKVSVLVARGGHWAR
jgi:hypothetical protein